MEWTLALGLVAIGAFGGLVAGAVLVGSDAYDQGVAAGRRQRQPEVNDALAGLRRQSQHLRRFKAAAEIAERSRQTRRQLRLLGYDAFKFGPCPRGVHEQVDCDVCSRKLCLTAATSRCRSTCSRASCPLRRVLR